MSSLLELQRNFANAVYSGHVDAIEPHIRAGRFPAARHLQIYRNNVYACLTDALRATYPVVTRLIGTDCFDACAHAYISGAPSTSGNLNDFGATFPDFIGQFPTLRPLIYLVDVARLEWAQHMAFHAAETAPLSLEALARIPPERYGTLRFQLHPSTHLLTSAYPVLRIWNANQPAAADETIRLDEGGVNLLVIRRHLEVQIEKLDDGESALLNAFALGTPFAAAAEATLALQPVLDMAGILRRRVADHTIVGFEPGDGNGQEVT